MGCIPPQQDAAFVFQMEAVLEVYQRAYDPLHPVVCMDEQPLQLISHKHSPLSAQVGGIPERVDHAYIREGTCTLWMFSEPLAAWRDVRVTDQRTCLDWAAQIRQLLQLERFQAAEKITIVCDNLNTHKLSALY